MKFRKLLYLIRNVSILIETRSFILHDTCPTNSHTFL